MIRTRVCFFSKLQHCVFLFVYVCSCTDSESNPQTLLFSATCPSWVYEVAKKYMRPGCKHVDLIGKKTQKAATTVEVSVCVCVSVCRRKESSGALGCTLWLNYNSNHLCLPSVASGHSLPLVTACSCVRRCDPGLQRQPRPNHRVLWDKERRQWAFNECIHQAGR